MGVFSRVVEGTRQAVKFYRIARNLRLQELLDVPDDWRDSEDARRWVLALVNAGEYLASLTGTELDNQAVGLIDKGVRDESAWEGIHTILVAVLLDDPADAATAVLNQSEEIRRVALVYAFNPMYILLILQAIKVAMELVQKWQNFKDDQDNQPGNFTLRGA